MKRAAQGASFIAVLSLLTSVATAHAECAWVLWSHFILRDGDHLWADHAFASKRECRAAAKAVLQEAGARGNTVAGGRVTTTTGDLLPICLPDTVDPRGPKGK